MRLIDDDVAIIGLAGLFPGAPDVTTFWENILAGKGFITDSPDPAARKFFDPDSSLFERIYSTRGGYLGELATFDPLKFGIVPAEAKGGDLDQFLALSTATAALEDAGLDLGRMPRERVEVLIGHSTYFSGGNVVWFQHGVALDQTVEVVRHLNPDLDEAELQAIRTALKESLPPMTTQTPPTLIPNIVAGRIANRLDLMGTSYILDAACATSHLTVANAVKDLLTDACDFVIAGATQAAAMPLETMLFCAIGGHSRLPELRPFDRGADGTMLGEGVGMLILQRRRDAERDGHRIYAIIRGIGSASDGRAMALLAPRKEGQALAIRRAYESAEVDPITVEFLECHGTGIPLGDVTEIEALRENFGARRGSVPTVGIGSIKSMIGHCRAAAGMAGMIKATLALHHKILPPTRNVEEPNPDLHLADTPFYVNTETRPWNHPANGTPRRAGVSAMGFGGIDAHCVLEEHV
ncbi:MAG: polyketide synthase [Acidobacteriota bacterium]|jgi:acyl transferase domain-containing protein